jgi:oligopeptide/dipeptide ABC transporter ATP-binding protein
MFAGRVVESGPTEQLLSSPAHPHTRALRDAVPTMGGGLPAVVGQPAAEVAEVAGNGCAYRNRCPFATEVCRHQAPELRRVGEQAAACHHAEQVLRSGDAVVRSS